MDQMLMLQQLMKAPNKMVMLENLINQNPQLGSAWKMAQQLSQNSNKQEVINEIAKQKGMSSEEIISLARKYGINL